MRTWTPAEGNELRLQLKVTAPAGIAKILTAASTIGSAPDEELHAAVQVLRIRLQELDETLGLLIGADDIFEVAPVTLHEALVSASRDRRRGPLSKFLRPPTRPLHPSSATSLPQGAPVPPPASPGSSRGSS